MTTFEAQFILRQTVTLAVHIAGQTDRLAGKPPDKHSLQRMADVVLPGVVAFLGRLSAASPGDEDRFQPIVDTFFTSPATATGIIRLSSGDQTAIDELVEAFLAASEGQPPLSRSDFESALAELAAAMQEAVRQNTSRTGVQRWIADLYNQVCPVFLNADYESHHSTASYLIDALTAAGLSGVRDGQVIAADGVTVIFAWYGQMAETAAEPFEESEPLAGEGPPETANGGGRQEPPSPPQPPEIVTPGEPPQVVTLRLDAALPVRVTVGREFVLAVSIRQPNSPLFAPPDLTRRESAGFTAVWPENAPFISLRIQVRATGCDVVGTGVEPVRLPAGQDGPPVYFQLIPRQTGDIDVIITVYQEVDWIGSARVITNASKVESRGELAISVESRPVGNTDANLQVLRRALDDGYNLEELRDLCFELGIDFEDLPGETQSGKARELVLYARRHGLEARLVEQVMRDRPHLLVPA